MANENRIKNICTRIRRKIFNAISARLGLDAEWIQNHIANCPRCRMRLASAGRVDIALMLTKSQTHRFDLLSRANAQAIGVLKHSLRSDKKAVKLRTAIPEPTFLQRYSRYARPAANTAACIAVVFLMKTSIFTSFRKCQDNSRQVLKQYYAKNLGEDLANDIMKSS